MCFAVCAAHGRPVGACVLVGWSQAQNHAFAADHAAIVTPDLMHPGVVALMMMMMMVASVIAFDEA
jgi:hypothetical protein